jgi:hypothetical protein
MMPSLLNLAFGGTCRTIIVLGSFLVYFHLYREEVSLLLRKVFERGACLLSACFLKPGLFYFLL